MLPGVDINRYAYAGNDPVNMSDPNGHLLKEGIATLVYADAITPDPTDAALPAKAVGYAVGMTVAATLDVGINYMMSADPPGPNGNTVYHDKDFSDEDWAEVETRAKNYLGVPGTTTKS